MKILICGGTGFIGRNMLEHFVTLGHEVHAIEHIKAVYSIEGVTWHWRDLRDPKAVERSVTGMDIIIQCAATTSGSKDIVNTPWVHVQDNTVMNAHIFRAAVEAKVKHVIFFSCSTMFSQGHVTEDSPIDIHPKYFGVAHMKLYNENMCDFYSRIGDTKFTAIRHSNCYGPHDKYDLERSHVFGATVTKVMQATDKITVWGTGEEKRDLLYISNLCEFVEAVIEKQGDKFKLYNCGAGYAVSINQLVQRIIATARKKLSVTHDLTAPTIQTSLSLDCTKAKNELGWSPKITLDDGIAKTISWYKDNIG